VARLCLDLDLGFVLGLDFVLGIGFDFVQEGNCHVRKMEGDDLLDGHKEAAAAAYSYVAACVAVAVGVGVDVLVLVVVDDHSYEEVHGHGHDREYFVYRDGDRYWKIPLLVVASFDSLAYLRWFL